MKINKLRLKDILKDYEVWEQEFEYAEVPGIAELFGYYIVFFRPARDLCNTVAISISSDEYVETSIIPFANIILRALDMNLKFGESTIEEINSIYGTADWKLDDIVDGYRYHYLINPDLLMVFEIRKKVLWGLEIIADEEIVKDVVDVRRLGAIL